MRCIRSLGAKLKLMTPNMLKEQFPWLNTDGIAIGCFGKKRFRQKRERKKRPSS